MGTTYRFISTPSEASLILDWFRGYDPAPIEQPMNGGARFFFGEVPASKHAAVGVSVFLPRRRFGTLTTAGEVHFLSKPLTAEPDAAKADRRFRKWIAQHPRIHSFTRPADTSFDYYLEGNLRNLDSDIYALPTGIEALQAGGYFVSDDDSDGRLEDLCKQLRLRGVEGLTQAEQGAADQLPARGELKSQ